MSPWSIPPILKIGKNTSIDNVIDINDKSSKQVRFTNEPPTTIINKEHAEEDEDDVSTFLSILNSRSDGDNGIVGNNAQPGIYPLLEERLKRIEETQKEILELLKGALPFLNQGAAPLLNPVVDSSRNSAYTKTTNEEPKIQSQKTDGDIED